MASNNPISGMVFPPCDVGHTVCASLSHTLSLGTTRRRRVLLGVGTFNMHTIIRLLAVPAVTALALGVSAAAQTPSPSDQPGKPAPTDKHLSGAITPDRVSADLEKAAKARQDSGKGTAEVGRW